MMDPFTGLGSTAVACARLGVNFVGSDIDEMYLTEAVERMRGGWNAAARCPAGARREWRRRERTRATASPTAVGAAGLGGLQHVFLPREHVRAPLRVTFTSIWRRRLVASGLLE